MEFLSFIGIVYSEPSGWIKDLIRKYEVDRRKNGEPRYIIIGIDYGYNFEAEDDREIPVVIGNWRD